MNIKIKNSNQKSITIDVEGIIGEDEEIQFGTGEQADKVSTFAKFRTMVEQIDREELESLRVNIRSAGGSLQDALLIYSLLQDLSQDCEIETHCYGFSASAATIIAQAASPGKRYVASSALYMIHNSSTQFDGNAIEAESVAEMLLKTDAQIAELYSQRSGNEIDYFAELMARDGGRGEWLTAQEAVDAGLADEVENFLSVKSVMNSLKGLFAKIFRTGNGELKAQNSIEDLGVEAESCAENSSVDKPKTEGVDDDDCCEDYSNDEFEVIGSDAESLSENSKNYADVNNPIENKEVKEVQNYVDATAEIESQLKGDNEAESEDIGDSLGEDEYLMDSEFDYLLVDVSKTITISKEDPEFEALAIAKSENQSAYSNDVALFRGR